MRRTLSLLAVSLFVMLFGGSLAAQNQQNITANTVTAERITLVDSNRVPKLILGTTAAGSVLSIRDLNGTERIAIGVIGNDEAGISLADGSGNEVVRLNVTGDQAGLRLFDSGGTNRLLITLEDNRKTFVSMFDSGGTNRLRITLQDNGTTVSMFDSIGQQRLQIQGEESSGFYVFDGFARNRAFFGTVDDSPTIELTDANRRKRLKLLLTNEVTALGLIDSSDTVRGAFFLDDRERPFIGLFDGMLVPLFFAP